jgi:signal transduction histidine kinase
MKRLFGKRLRTRLNLILLLTLIPAWALTIYTAAEQRRLEREAILQNALILTRAIADEEGQMLRATQAVLRIMADLASGVGTPHRQNCDIFDDFLKNAPEYLQLGVLSADGRLVCQVGAAGPQRPFSDASWFAETLRSREFTLGGDRVEAVSGQPAIYAARPLLDAAGDIEGAVFAALSLDAISRPAVRILGGLPEGSALVQIDPARGQLVYEADSRCWTDTKVLGASLVTAATGSESGVLQGDGGDARIYAYASLKSPLTQRPVSIVLAIPKHRAFAASNRILIRNLLLLGLVATTAIAVVWIGSELFFLKPLGEMASASQRLAAGDLSARIGDISGADELRRLAGSFDQMAEALQTRIVLEQEAKKQLETSRQRLRNLTGYLQDVREQERTRIARELHDDFSQSLTILKLDLAWLKKRLPEDDPKIDEKIAAMGQVLDAALETMHTVTAELRPVILDDFGLPAALEWQTDEFKNRTGLDCRIEIDPELPALSKNLATALFRIFQELLTNIIRHAGASRVDVLLKKEDRRLVLTVMDDGRGITETQVEDARSFGLIGIRERLHPFGGSARFTGGTSGGTRVTVEVPLEEENPQS